MVPPLQILDDLGKDYGIYAGGAGRTGYVTPQQPYPDANSPPTVTNVSPASGWLLAAPPSPSPAPASPAPPA